MKTFLLLTTVILAGSLGELLSARGMREVGEVSLRRRELPRSLGRAARNRYLYAALGCLALAFFAFLSLLSYAELSYVVPLSSASYITNTVGARWFLKEKVSKARWVGTLLVAGGVVIVSLPQETAESISLSAQHLLHALSSLLSSSLSPVQSAFFWPLLVLRLLLLMLVVCSIIYYAIAVWAGWLWFRDRHRQRELGTWYRPPVTILIPVCGADEWTYENLASFCRQDYPQYQLIFGVREESDPATGVIKQLQADFPACPIELVISQAEIGHNAKVSNLHNIYPRASHDLLLIVDSDIRVGPDYLSRIVAPMQEAQVGLVTCLYRGTGSRTPGALIENLGHTSTFGPEVVTARALEGIKFALGSTILMRRETLEQIGGFRAVADYLADDFLLGRYVAEAGYQVVLSDYVVEHVCGPISFSTMLRHQLRWGRSTRISRPKGYAGLILTYGTATSLLALLAFQFSTFAWALFGATLLARALPAWIIGVVGLKDRLLAKYFWLLPLRDLIGFGIWAASFSGDKIEWRSATFRVLPDGRITPIGNS
jgi:ceramide glucosyltransferase